MPCTKPIKGWRANRVNPETGKRSFVTTLKDAYVDMPMEIACGQCMFCRLKRSSEWATRMMHEASLYEDNSFITLTYSDDNLPENGSLHLPDFQNFMKALRREFGAGIRFYHCGEYGEQLKRPHYHAILFNLDFQDKYPHTERNGHLTYRSETLEKLWTKGYSEIGAVTFESAAYVARYVTKKITRRSDRDHYDVVENDSGLVIGSLKPEYATMSRRPGIARAWWDKFKQDVKNIDGVVRAGLKLKTPKFYDNLYDIDNPKAFAKAKALRKNEAEKRKEDNTWPRLKAKEKWLESKTKTLSRSYENGT